MFEHLWKSFEKQTRELKDLKISRFDLVDSPANQYAKILLYKRNENIQEGKAMTADQLNQELEEAVKKIRLEKREEGEPVTREQAMHIFVKTAEGEAWYRKYRAASYEGSRVRQKQPERELTPTEKFNEELDEKASQLVESGKARSRSEAVRLLMRDPQIYKVYRNLNLNSSAE